MKNFISLFKPNGLAYLFLAFITTIFCLPLLIHLNHLLLGDWDQMVFYNEVPQISILTYHQFPLWNPYYCGGMTLIGNPQNQFLSPFTLINLIFGVVTGLKIRILISLFIGNVGMYLLSRHFNIKGIIALLPGILFTMNGSLVMHLAEGHFWS
jgi:hypothetical protein